VQLADQTLLLLTHCILGLMHRTLNLQLFHTSHMADEQLLANFTQRESLKLVEFTESI